MTLVHLGGMGPAFQGDRVVVQVADVQIQVGGEGVVQPVVAQGVVGPVGGENEVCALAPKRRMQIVKPVPPQGPLVVGHHVVPVQVGLPVFKRRHEQERAVGRVTHVQDLVDFEQFSELHLPCPHAHQTKVWGTPQFGGKCQGSTLRVPRQARMQVVFESRQAVAEGGMPSVFAAFQFEGAHPQLTALVGGEGHVFAIWRRDELGVFKPTLQAHGNGVARRSLSHSPGLGAFQRRQGCFVPTWGVPQVIGPHFRGQVVQVESGGQANPALHTSGDSGHVQDVGDGGHAVDVRHIGPNRLSKHGRFQPRTLVQALEGPCLASVEDAVFALGIEPARGVAGGAF